MAQRRKTYSAAIAVLLSIALMIASRAWPRSAEDKLIESSFTDLVTSMGSGDALKARVLFSLPDVMTDAKLEELAQLLHKNGRTVKKSTYLGSVEGKVGDHTVLSTTFLLKYTDDSESLLNAVSDIRSWGNEKPFIMSITVTDSADAVRKAVQFLPSENGLRSYFLLLMGVAALVVSTYAVYKVLALRPKYWFAWLLLCLVGVLRFRLNWATEDYDIQLLTVAIPCFEIVRYSVLSPWLFTFGVPVGAIAFLNHVGGTDLEDKADA